MKKIKAVALASILMLGMSGAATAQSNPAKANTSDPNSAPMVKTTKVKKPADDKAAKANTADPNSAPMAKTPKVKKTAKDAPAKANTADPNSAPGK